MARWSRHLRWLALLLALVVAVTLYFRAMSYLGWRRALREAGFVDEMAPPAAGDRVLVVAPHPDDETLGCGGLIQEAVSRGAEVHVAMMTNGDASELAVIFGDKELSRSPSAFIDLGRARQWESVNALFLLGIQPNHLHFLGFPNNGLVPLWRPEHWPPSDLYRSPYTQAFSSPYEHCFTPHAPYCGHQVLSDLIALLQQVRPTAVFVTHPQDIHPDHWATACFVQYALATIAVGGGDWARQTRVYGYLIHWPHYPVPHHKATKLDLLPPPELASAQSRWLSLPLTSEQTNRKVQAIKRYRSQEPGFDRLLLSLARTSEAFEELPMVQAHPGQTLSWQDDATRRRGLNGAKVVSLQLSLPDNDPAKADLTCLPTPIRESGYVCLDLRTWDPDRAPVITTVYLRAGEKPSSQRLKAGAPAAANSLQVAAGGPGQFEITGDLLPPGNPQDTDLFVSCWGSLGDRLTDPIAASWISIRTAP